MTYYNTKIIIVFMTNSKLRCSDMIKDVHNKYFSIRFFFFWKKYFWIYVWAYTLLM